MGMPITVDVGETPDGTVVRARLRVFRSMSTAVSAPTGPTAKSQPSTGVSFCRRLERRDDGSAGARRDRRETRPTAISTSAQPDGRSILPASSRAGPSAMRPRLSRGRASATSSSRPAATSSACGRNASGMRLERRHPQSLRCGRDHQGGLPARPRRRHLRHLCARPAHLQSAWPGARSRTSSA